MKVDQLQISRFMLTLVMTSYLQPIKAKRCTQDDQCQFTKSCTNGTCRCDIGCEKYGENVICGDDGNYYKNKCFLLEESCRRQRKIGIRSVGRDNHCKKHPLHVIATKLREPVCGRSYEHYCLNFGICVKTKYWNYCRCPPQFVGDRCQSRSERDWHRFTLIKQRRVMRQAPSPQKQQDRKFKNVQLFLICFFSALFSAVTTSALCHRHHLKKIKLLSKELAKERTTEASSIDIESSLRILDQRKSDEIVETRFK